MEKERTQSHSMLLSQIIDTFRILFSSFFEIISERSLTWVSISCVKMIASIIYHLFACSRNNDMFSVVGVYVNILVPFREIFINDWCCVLVEQNQIARRNYRFSSWLGIFVTVCVQNWLFSRQIKFFWLNSVIYCFFRERHTCFVIAW